MFITRGGRKSGSTLHVAFAAMMFGLALIATGQAAQAASFDCAKATTAREHLVCANPDLSKLDDDLDQSYRRGLSQLSPSGAERLKVGQRQWLVFLERSCPMPEQAVSTAGKNCVVAAYRDRLEDLKQAAVRNGPYLFTRVDSYSVQPAPKDDDEETAHDRRPSVRHVAYPQIDQPINATTRRWNSIASQIDDEPICGPTQDDEVGYRLGLATKRLISESRGSWAYCYGMAHGNGQDAVQNSILTPSLRQLQPDDLFRQGKPWRAKLTALVRAAVTRQARELDPDLSHLDVGAIAAAAASPDRWFLRKEGLQINFESYELGEGYPFVPTVIVPWSALSGVLSAVPR